MDVLKKQVIDKIAKQTTHERQVEWAMDIDHFDWVPGVGLYGIYKAWEVTSHEEYMSFLMAWADKHLQEAFVAKTVNSTAPLLTMVELYRIYGTEEYIKVCIEIADWIVNEAPKTREGGLEHTVTEDVAGFKEQIWADTLFMVCIFLSKLGVVTADKRYTEMACKQLLIHHRLLKDEKTGLFFHGWNCNLKNWMSGALWGRANAWMLVSTVEMLEQLPQVFEGREEIIVSLHQQVDALAKWQRENGMFGTLLNDLEAYDETSATAGIAYGIKKGVRLGLIDHMYNKIWEKAEKAVIDRVDKNGEVCGVSTGTPILPSLEAYKNIAICPTLYGQGLTLMLLSEE